METQDLGNDTQQKRQRCQTDEFRNQDTFSEKSSTKNSHRIFQQFSLGVSDDGDKKYADTKNINSEIDSLLKTKLGRNDSVSVIQQNPELNLTLGLQKQLSSTTPKPQSTPILKLDSQRILTTDPSVQKLNNSAKADQQISSFRGYPPNTTTSYQTFKDQKDLTPLQKLSIIQKQCLEREEIKKSEQVKNCFFDSHPSCVPPNTNSNNIIQTDLSAHSCCILQEDCPNYNNQQQQNMTQQQQSREDCVTADNRLNLTSNVSASTPQFKERFNRSLKSTENNSQDNNSSIQQFINRQNSSSGQYSNKHKNQLQHQYSNQTNVATNNKSNKNTLINLTYSQCVKNRQLQYRLKQLKPSQPLNMLNLQKQVDENLQTSISLQESRDQSHLSLQQQNIGITRCDSPFKLYQNGVNDYSPLSKADANRDGNYFFTNHSNLQAVTIADQELNFTTKDRPNSQCDNKNLDFKYQYNINNISNSRGQNHSQKKDRKSSQKSDKVAEIESSEVAQEQQQETPALKLNLFRFQDEISVSKEGDSGGKYKNDQHDPNDQNQEGECNMIQTSNRVLNQLGTPRSEITSQCQIKRKIRNKRKSHKFVQINVFVKKGSPTNPFVESTTNTPIHPNTDVLSSKDIQKIMEAERPESPSSSNFSSMICSSEQVSASEYSREFKLRQIKSTMTAHNALAPYFNKQKNHQHLYNFSRNMSPQINTQLVRSQRSMTKSLHQTSKRKVTDIGSPTFKLGPPGLLSHDKPGGLCKSFSMRNLSMRNLGKRVSPPSAKCTHNMHHYNNGGLSPTAHRLPTLMRFQSSNSLVESHPRSRRTSMISEARSDMGNSSLLRKLQQIQAMPASLKVSAYKQMTLTIFHSLNFIKQIPSIPPIPDEQKIDFQFRKAEVKKLLIFDLDETLIHSKREDDELEENQQLWQIYKEENRDPDEWVEIIEPDCKESFMQGFYKRPYLIECLQLLNRYYEIAIFTAGYEWYANPIIDKIDPDGSLIQHRYFRQHTNCITQKNQNLFVKDLSLFKNLDLTNVLFVDNAIVSFSANLRNGIPIVDYTGQFRDTELLKISHYLSLISGEHNLIEANERTFQLHKILQTDIESYIKYYSIDELSEYDETDFEDDGNTAGSSSGNVDQYGNKVLLGTEERDYGGVLDGSSPTGSHDVSDNQSLNMKQHKYFLRDNGDQNGKNQKESNAGSFQQEVTRFTSKGPPNYSRFIFADPIPETASEKSKVNTPTLIRNVSSDSLSLKDISPCDSGSNSVSLVGQTSQSNKSNNKLTSTSKSSSPRRGSLISNRICNNNLNNTNQNNNCNELVNQPQTNVQNIFLQPEHQIDLMHRSVQNQSRLSRTSPPITGSNRKQQNSDRDGNMGGTPYHLDSEDEHNQQNSEQNLNTNQPSLIAIQRKRTNQTNNPVLTFDEPSGEYSKFSKRESVQANNQKLVEEYKEFQSECKDNTSSSENFKSNLSFPKTSISPENSFQQIRLSPERQYTIGSKQTSESRESQKKVLLVPKRNATFGKPAHHDQQLYVSHDGGDSLQQSATIHSAQSIKIFKNGEFKQQWIQVFASPPPGPNRSRGFSPHNNSKSQSPVRLGTANEGASSSYYKTKNYSQKKFAIHQPQKQSTGFILKSKSSPPSNNRNNAEATQLQNSQKVSVQEKKRIKERMQSDMKAQINLFKGVQLYDVIKPPNWTARKQSLMQRKGLFNDTSRQFHTPSNQDSPQATVAHQNLSPQNQPTRSPNVIRNIDYHLDQLQKCFERKSSPSSKKGNVAGDSQYQQPSDLLSQVLSANKQYASRYGFFTPKNHNNINNSSNNQESSNGPRVGLSSEEARDTVDPKAIQSTPSDTNVQLPSMHSRHLVSSRKLQDKMQKLQFKINSDLQLRATVDQEQLAFNDKQVSVTSFASNSQTHPLLDNLESLNSQLLDSPVKIQQTLQSDQQIQSEQVTPSHVKNKFSFSGITGQAAVVVASGVQQQQFQQLQEPKTGLNPNCNTNPNQYEETKRKVERLIQTNRLFSAKKMALRPTRNFTY